MPTLSALLTPLSLLSLSLPSLILSESRSIYLGSSIFKLIASTAFVWRSLLPLSSTPLLPSVVSAKWWITFSLISGLVGDFCLIPSKKSYYNPSGGHEGDSVWFKLGMLAFMVNHAGYIGAFLQFVKGGVVENIDWKIFGGVFVICVLLGDLCGMPVPWRDDAAAPHQSSGGNEGRTRSSSPRLPTTSSDTKPLDLSSKKDAYRNGTRHARSDSGVTDLSISIPSTPTSNSSNNSPTTSTPLLSSRTSATSTSTLGGIIPKLVIPSDMKPLIIIYQLIITTMVASAAGTRGILSERLLGAFMFMVSDVMVAWDTFGVKPARAVDASTKSEERRSKGRQGWKSRGFGWVLYFGGQYILAAYGAK
ncbi:uncharacterized protein DFL_000452 [Arthrobotrys flagrans]|uniref:Uncharacterized protein n=1 Tax=Arthrobotrys flagrans TaxID=97331 RepID=A0A437AE00_ARTFL|nr:hypothetical protein DFL_000452 [Arthrobotrys flagrans]